jgi:CubicO group peptidase (beta-lactamase class C family)
MKIFTRPTFLLAFLMMMIAGTAVAQKKKKDKSSSASKTDLVYTKKSFGSFMKNWSLAGPVAVQEGNSAPDEETQRKFFAEDIIPKTALKDGKPIPAFQYNGKPLKWISHTATNDAIELDNVYPNTDYAAVYAWAEIIVDADSAVLMGIGSDDGVKVWHNDKLIHDHWTPRGLTPDQDVVPLNLVKGSNRILLKVQDMQGGWGFSARVLDKPALSQKLVSAAKGGLLDEIKTLLAAGADVNGKDKNGLTAYEAAKLAGREEVIAALGEKGADQKMALAPDQLIEATYRHLNDKPSPATVVLVAQNGKIVFQKAYGLADVATKTPATLDTKFRIGSITKQFTASAILKLQEEGKISVDDKLSKFFPDFPRGNEVTIHHLLTHTSGIHSYTGKADFIDKVLKPVTNEELLAYFKNDPYDFNPGEQYQYNNSGYFLLGYIIEKVSGKSYAQYLDETFFKPLGMKNTGIHASTLKLTQEAIGHGQEGDKFKTALNWDMSWAGGAGAIYSTVGDLFTWNEAVFGGKVLQEKSLKAAHTSVVLNNGKIPDQGKYGYGWGMSEYRETAVIGHSGGLHGFISQLARFPAHQMTVAILTNISPPVSELNPSVIAEYFIWDKLGKQRSFSTVATTVDVKTYEGRYDFRTAVMTITSQGGNLYAQLFGQQNFPIFPQGPDEFYWKVVPARIKFVKNEKGEVTHGEFEQNGQKLTVQKLKDEPIVTIDPAVWKQFEGKYKFQEMIITVSVTDGKLLAQATNQPTFQLYPLTAENYLIKEINAKISFVRSQDKVTHMTIDMAGQKSDAPRLE